MTALDSLPDVDSFLGVDLKTGCHIIAALGIVHPIAFGCTCFLPMSYLMLTIWMLVAFYFVASVALFYGLSKDDSSICVIWVWFTLVFLSLMVSMLGLLFIVSITRKQRNRILAILLAIAWYLGTIYFVLVVNSHRKQLGNTTQPLGTTTTTTTTTTTEIVESFPLR